MPFPSGLKHQSFGIGELFERLDDAIVIFECAGARVVLCNSAAERLFGYPPDALAGIALDRLFAEDLSLVAASGERFETRARTRDGAAVWVDVSLSAIATEAAPGEYRLAIVRDIGDRKRNEAALEASEARFRAFMDNGPAIASMRDDQGRYLYTNALHRKLFGSDDWIGTTALERLPEEIAEQVLADDQVVLRTGRPAHFEERMPGPDQPLTLLTFKFPFLDSAGKPLIGSLGVDVTPLKQAQAALLERSKELEAANQALQQADRYKDEFLSIFSHELRTPITTIRGFVELLEDGAAGPLTSEQQDFVAQVARATQRLLALVNDLFDFAKLQAGVFPLNRQRYDLVLAVREMAESLAPRAEEAGIELSVETPPSPIWAEIDIRQIGRVMFNLLDNALRFTDAGGRVTVKSTLNGQRFLTEVTDTGIGLAPEHMPKLFDRFWQLDTSSTRTGGGLGLGLPLAKAIVEGHGGTLGARSSPGEGSTFWFELNLENLAPKG